MLLLLIDGHRVRWRDKQERGFTRWMNHILTPSLISSSSSDVTSCEDETTLDITSNSTTATAALSDNGRCQSVLIKLPSHLIGQCVSFGQANISLPKLMLICQSIFVCQITLQSCHYCDPFNMEIEGISVTTYLMNLYGYR